MGNEKKTGRKERFLLRNAQFRVEKSEDLTVLEGYAAVFDQTAEIWGFTESIRKGAFEESISRGDDVAALIDHDPSRIVARSPKTLELEEDDHGLKVRITPADTTVSRDLIENIRAGNISQMSIGFFVEEELAEFDNREKPHFTITRAKLFDVSAVTFPTYEGTEIAVSRFGEVSEEEVAARLRPYTHERALAQLKKRQREREIASLGS